MGPCPPLFGNLTVFVVVDVAANETNYRVARESLLCYLRSTNYTLKYIDIDADLRVRSQCKHEDLMYRKHCAASIYLVETDWMLVLDADTGVVNPNHCIEEYIDDRVDIVLYERFFNWEIMSGNYLIRNTPFARNFLRTWADLEYVQPYNWSGRDNGALQIHVLRTVLQDAKVEAKACENIWHRAVDYETYMAYVVCIKMALGATRLFPGKLRILRRAHGFARDGGESWDSWSEKDFMFHGWKAQDVGTDEWESPFEKRFDLSECGTGYAGWNWRPQKRISVAKIKEMLAENEKFNAQAFPSTRARFWMSPTSGNVIRIVTMRRKHISSSVVPKCFGLHKIIKFYYI